MTEAEPQFIEVGTGEARRRIAYRREARPGSGKPGLFWCAGFKSDMASTKATALAAHAATRGIDCVRFDYSGHGISEGPFEKGTIGRWLEEAETVFRTIAKGPQIIIGSSMGGHIALMLLKRLLENDPAEAARITALVLIAPAWDMTEELMWKQFPPDARRALETDGVYYEPSNYGEPYTITRALIEDGRAHLLARNPFRPRRRPTPPSCKACKTPTSPPATSANWRSSSPAAESGSPKCPTANTASRAHRIWRCSFN